MTSDTEEAAKRREHWARVHIRSFRSEPIFIQEVRRPDCIIQTASRVFTSGGGGKRAY